MKMEPRFVTRKVVATSQITLSILFSLGYFGTLWEFIHGKIQIDPQWKDSIQQLLALLTAGELMILQFWFSRSRPEDPGRKQ